MHRWLGLLVAVSVFGTGQALAAVCATPTTSMTVYYGRQDGTCGSAALSSFSNQVSASPDEACTSARAGVLRYSNDAMAFCNGTSWSSLSASSASAVSSTGAIQFNVANSLAGDGANLFWDDANNRLGIGMTAPQATLQVSGSFTVSTSQQTTSPSLYVDTSGNVGIGTSAPTPAVAGRQVLQIGSSSAGGNEIRLIAGSVQARMFNTGSSVGYGTDSNHDFFIYSNSGANPRIYLRNSGNVGIGGITTPQAALQVSGSFIVSTSAQTTTPTLYADTSGQVGIGTTASAARLMVADAGYTGTFLSYIQADDANPWMLNFRQNTAAQDWGIYVGNDDTFHLYDRTDSRDVLVLDGSGNVGIGTAAPNEAFSVVGNMLLQSSVGKYGFQNDATNYYLGGAMTTDSGIVGHGYYGWTFRGGSGVGLRVDASSNVGIGTVTPTVKLDVASVGTGSFEPLIRAIGTGSTAFPVIQIDRPLTTRAAALEYSTAGTANWYTGLQYNGGVAESGYGISTDGTLANTKLYVSSAGNVGIGTSSPGSLLHLYGTAPRLSIQDSQGGGKNWTLETGNVVGGQFNIRNLTDSINALNITSAGLVGIGLTGQTHLLQLNTDDGFKPNGGSWGNSSDARLKTNVKPIGDALERITKLNGVFFDWKNPAIHGGTAASGGFIAQDVAKVFPEFVKQSDCSAEDCKLVGGGKIYNLTLPFTFDAYVVEAFKELKQLRDEDHATMQGLKVANANLVSETTDLRAQLKAANDNYVRLKADVKALKAGMRR